MVYFPTTAILRTASMDNLYSWGFSLPICLNIKISEFYKFPAMGFITLDDWNIEMNKSQCNFFVVNGLTGH
jgi:hypothetical protein